MKLRRIRLGILQRRWRGVKASTQFRHLVSFSIFVGIATAFWFVVALNESALDTVDIHLRVVNVPDSVTFIVDPPEKIHVSLRDRGTNILRTAKIRVPELELNFRDYAQNGVFRFSRTELNTSLKNLFGGSAQILSTSIDSLRLNYTTDKGRRVPVVVCADVTASAGNVLSSRPKVMQRSVMVYSYDKHIDTLTRVYTEAIVLRNLGSTTEVEVKLKPQARVKMVPSVVKVQIPVEPLVRRESMVAVTAANVPSGVNLLFFPNKVHVVYYVPMSLFSSDLIPVEVNADYNEIRKNRSDRLSIRVKGLSDYVVNPELRVDSVEYTVVRE